MIRYANITRVLALLWIVYPLSAQDVPTPNPGLGPALDPSLVELTRGREVRFDSGGGGRVEGELLAVDDRSMWLLSGGQTRNVALAGLEEIQVRRHGFGQKQVWTWIGIGAGVTGLGLAAACSSADASGCGGVLPAVALSWGLIGGLFSLDISGSRWAEVPPVSQALLRYTRFPQGLPEGYGR